MKQQYIVGQKAKDFVRMSDGRSLFGCSLDLDEAKEAKKVIKGGKIFKLVEVKK